MINSQIVVEVEKGIGFAGRRVTIDASVFFPFEPVTLFTDQVHHPFWAPIRAHPGEIRFFYFLIEVYPFRSAIGVRLGTCVRFFSGSRVSAFGETDVQINAAVVSDALKRDALSLVSKKIFEEDYEREPPMQWTHP